MLSGTMLRTLSIELHLLHVVVVARSKEGDMCYKAKVIERVHFVDESTMDKIYLHFNEVIYANIFYVSTVSPSFMRLWALDQASDCQVRHSNVAIVDPYHMHWHNMESTYGQKLIADYLFLCMIVNRTQKDTYSCHTSKRKSLALIC